MRINAVAPNESAFSPIAAQAYRDVSGIRSLLNAANVELNPKVKLFDLDAKLSASRLSITQRLQIKSVLSRYDLIEG
jgi:hypothetical protein